MKNVKVEGITYLAEVALEEKSNSCATHCYHKNEWALKTNKYILRIFKSTVFHGNL